MVTRPVGEITEERPLGLLGHIHRTKDIDDLAQNRIKWKKITYGSNRVTLQYLFSL